MQYALRLDPQWRVRQLLLFRDLDEPDLWLGHDGGGRWGEINGAHRPDLDGCVDVELSCTPFTLSLPVRRLGLGVGEAADLPVVSIDVGWLVSSGELVSVCPGGVFVVEGVVSEAAVEDADESVGERS